MQKWKRRKNSVALGVAAIPAKGNGGVVTDCTYLPLAVNRADAKVEFLMVGGEVVGSLAESSAAAVKSEMARMEKVNRDADIRAE